MRRALALIEVYGLTVGLASCAQMVWYFIELTVFGVEHVAVFEPDTFTRITEAVLSTTGLAALLLTACRVIGPHLPRGAGRRGDC